MEINGIERLRMRFADSKRTRVHGVHRIGKFDVEVTLEPKKDVRFINTMGPLPPKEKSRKQKRTEDGDYLEIDWPASQRRRKGKEKLHSFHYLGKEIGLYLGGDQYPEQCCVCCQPVTRYWFLEKWESTSPGVTELETLHVEKGSEARLPEIRKILSNDRFWYAVPFCDQHDLRDGFMVGNIHGEKFGFYNSEYGKLFAELNGYDSHWVDRSEARSRERGSCLATIGLVLLILPLAIIMLESKSGDLGFLPYLTIPGIVLILVGLILRVSAKRRGRSRKPKDTGTVQ